LGKALETFNLFPSLAEIKKPIKKHTIDTVELTDDPKAIELWDVCLQLIKDNIGDQMFKTWFAPTKALRWQEDVLVISVPSQFFCEWIEEHYFTLLRKVVSQVLGSKARLQYQVVVDKGKSSLEDRAITLPALRNPPAPTSGQAALPFINTPQAVQHYPTYLNPRYIFDNFIRGDSNQLAVSAALAVSDSPGKTKFNPLCIYGGTGLGKTHLIQAIGNHIVQNNRNLRVFYTNSERFTIEYVNAIQNNKVNEFTNFYRSIDVLIVDDIQFFSGKEKTQDNFFHTFNALYQSGKQIILFKR
jgi:chromosomal replication initiator protein